MEFQIKNVGFEQSSPTLKECPKPDYPEFAFIGRSNVGKSSLINMLANNRKLAYISGSPGKTRLVNFFLVDNKWRIVDLPGYGYARVGKAQRTEFKQLILDYIGKRENLQCVFVLLDSRIPPQDLDIRFINWLGTNSIPFVLTGTKCEKVSKAGLENFKAEYYKVLSESWDQMPEMIFTSAVKKIGYDDILSFISSTLNNG